VEGREEGDGSKQEERATRLQQGERISESGGTEATMHKMSEGDAEGLQFQFLPHFARRGWDRGAAGDGLIMRFNNLARNTKQSIKNTRSR
jgi:hypothetical protein